METLEILMKTIQSKQRSTYSTSSYEGFLCAALCRLDQVCFKKGVPRTRKRRAWNSRAWHNPSVHRELVTLTEWSPVQVHLRPAFYHLFCSFYISTFSSQQRKKREKESRADRKGKKRKSKKEDKQQNTWKNLCYPEELIETDGHPITEHPFHHRLRPGNTNTRQQKKTHYDSSWSTEAWRGSSQVIFKGGLFVIIV